MVELDGKSAHYQFPIGAISSITNRVTGVMLSVGEQRRGGACIGVAEGRAAMQRAQNLEIPARGAGRGGAGLTRLTPSHEGGWRRAPSAAHGNPHPLFFRH